MFSTFKQRLLLGLYIFIILSIPVGAYLASETKNLKSSASEGSALNAKATPRPTLSPKKELLKNSETKALLSSPSPSSQPTPEPSSPTIATSFGPTLALKAVLEGRPANNQTTKLFVGIIEGTTLPANPKFLLSFSVDLPANGSYSNLSLAGLQAGTKYTALLKGAAQIAAASIFTMSPTVTNLNEGEAVNMLTGDLNEDNIINSTDISIIQKAYGSNSKSANWNENADLNKDGVVNAFDLGIISKNLGQVGASGAWTSPIPTATPSASLNNSSGVGGPVLRSPQGGVGYWIWIPK